MNIDSQLMKKSNFPLPESAVRLITIPENINQSTDCALFSLNSIVDKVFREIHKKDLEHGLNGNVIERFIKKTNGYQEVFSRVDTLYVLQESEKPIIRAVEDIEPVK